MEFWYLEQTAMVQMRMYIGAVLSEPFAAHIHKV